ncbi:DUF1642 domain-containing protein [Lactococcus lactis]|uniref:DUF1642 domain-containing protein n=1 Tax=Lactococcus lactis TaxID=1358 RepID=UPI002892219C|nr:DUF1642 domain-containing protein [Lactococcus lactis]MDT2889398.1 DUF1642 domain-containing protein [Lactococcus lactis]
MTKFEEEAIKEAEKSKVITKYYDGESTASDIGLNIKLGRATLNFPWLEFAKNWHSDEEFKELLDKYNNLNNLKLQQQALPVVPECVAGAIESIPDHYSAFEAISLINAKVNALPEENEDWLPVYNWLCEGVENQDVFALAFITRKYQVEKPKLFYLKAKELLVVGDYDHVEDLWLDWNKNFTPKKQDAHKFTQQEIDSMQTGSYEQIEVTE